MRRSWVVLLVLALAGTGCGDDEQPTPEALPPVAEEGAGEEPIGVAPDSIIERADRGGAPMDGPLPAGEGAAPAVEEAALPPGPLFTVQVASFLHADSATVLARRLVTREVPVWISEADVEGRRFHRVRLGAFQELDEARDFGEDINAEYGWPVWIALIENRAIVPDGAVQQTRDAVVED